MAPRGLDHVYAHHGIFVKETAGGDLASTLFFPGDGMWLMRLLIGITGSTIGSFSIGVFFAVPYQISSQIAANELRLTGKDHSAMYFAVQGVVTQVTFKGVHYEMIVRTEKSMWKIHDTSMRPEGTAVGLIVRPDDIHIMKKEART
jgi:hypothetical protein